MKLQLRLILSYCFLTLLFLGLVGALFPFFSGLLPPGPPGPPRPPHDVRSDLARLRADLESAYGRGGLAAARRFLGDCPLPPGDQLMMISPDGEVLARRGGQFTWNPALASLESAALDWGETEVSTAYWPLGQYRLVLRHPIEANPPVDEELLRRRTHEGLMKARVAGGLICLLLGVGLSALIVRPIERLVEATEQMGNEGFSIQVPEQGPGELAELARSFNRMGARLQESVDGLRAEKERVEALEASRRDFLADVSHNLGTPLAAALGWINALRDGIIRDPQERGEMLERVQRDLLYVSRMVRQLLDLSRWESQGPDLLWETFPLLEPLMEAVQSVEEAAQARHVSLAFEGIDSATVVQADRMRVRELFQIFLENAVKHAGASCHVKVAVASTDARWQVTVSDDGKGISQQELPRLRQRFQRLGGRGSGLGLAIAERLLQSHGSNLTIESEEGRGATIRFSLAKGAATI